MAKSGSHGRATPAVGMLCVLGFVLALVPGAGEASTDKVKLEAAFVYRFASLTTWPESAFENSDAPLRFGVVEDRSFADALQGSVSGKQLRGRKLEVSTISSGAACDDCHVIFVPSAHASQLQSCLDSARNQPVLTISDASSFAERGGIIQLDREHGKLRFSINLGAAVSSRLAISSKLLRLAADVIDSDSN